MNDFLSNASRNIKLGKMPSRYATRRCRWKQNERGVWVQYRSKALNAAKLHEK